jgi:hypothetical protein
LLTVQKGDFAYSIMKAGLVFGARGVSADDLIDTSTFTTLEEGIKLISVMQGIVKYIRRRRA